MKNYFWRSFILLTLFACNKPSAPDCLRQSGSFKVKEMGNINPVREIVLQSPLKVFVRYGTKEKIVLEGPENLLEKISVRQINKAIYIRNQNRCNFVRGYRHELRMYVYTPQLEYVRNNAVGNIVVEHSVTADTLLVESEGGDVWVYADVHTLKTSSHGNGNIYFKGQATMAFVYMFGTNFFYASEGNINNYAYVEQISVGDAHLKMNNGALLNFKIYKKGNIHVQGNVTADGLKYGEGNVYYY